MTKLGPQLERLLALAVSPDARTIAFGGARDAVPGSTLHLLPWPKLAPAGAAPMDGAVHAIAFASNEVAIAGTRAGTLATIELGAERRVLHTVAAHPGGVRALAARALGRGLVSAGADGVLATWTIGGDGALTRASTLPLTTSGLTALALDPEGERVAVGGEDGILRLVRGAAIRERAVDGGAITALAWLDDGRVAIGSADGGLRLVYAEGDDALDERSGDHAHTGAVRGLTLGPVLFDAVDAELPRRLFSIGDDGALKAWPLDSRRRPKTLELGRGPLTALVHVPARERAKPEDRGGRLVVTTRARTLALATLGPKGELEDTIEHVGSELDRLAEALDRGNPAPRQAAIEALATLGEDPARVLLEQRLDDDAKPELRALAAASLVKGGWRRSRAALVRAFDDAHVDVRRAAFEAACTLERDDPLTVVRAALDAAADDLRVLALERLPSLRATSPLVPALVAERLADASLTVRGKALEILTALEPAEAARIAMRRGAPDVRAEVLGTLLARADTPEARLLVEAALDDADTNVRSTAFLVAVATVPALAARLGAIEPRFQDALVKLGLGPRGEDAPRPADAPGRAQAALTEADKAPLFAAMASRQADTALRAARVLALVGDVRASGALLMLSREPDPAIRRYAVEALAVASTTLPAEAERLRARVAWLLDDPEALVRMAAFEALTALKTPELAATALRSAFEDVRVKALQLLVAAPRGEATDALVGDALDDESARVRNEAYKTVFSWHARAPRTALERAARSRHADVRRLVVLELERQRGDWVRPLVLTFVADPQASVGTLAYERLTQTDADKKRADVHLEAMRSTRPEVRALGAAGAAHAPSAEVVPRLRQLVEDDHPDVHLRAIESLDALVGVDEVAFAFALGSVFTELRVRAAELAGLRRNPRGVAAMRALLAWPAGHPSRPPELLRARAARALADVGDPSLTPTFVALLDDENPDVREGGARGLATAGRLGAEGPLLAALGHADLAVRSWAAEGLARLGDVRALPVLAGTQRHAHRPIRVGAILGFVALGPDGVQGILQGLSDPDREVQDLVFAIVVARDLALARAGLGPDLLVSALSAAHPELRFAAARALEARLAKQDLDGAARELVGPRRPERADALARWPSAERQQALLALLVAALASDDPEQRYAAAQVLTLRPQPEAFWREAARLEKPQAAGRAWIPHTSPGTVGVRRETRKRDWIRRIFGGEPAGAAEVPDTRRVVQVIRLLATSRPVPPLRSAGAELLPVIFGTYVGLVRQAPPRGDADETHRVRRDALERLAALASEPSLGREAVLPIARRALSDPHHLVRRAAMAALRALYADDARTPAALALAADAADVGRQAVDVLLDLALGGDAAARAQLIGALSARSAEVRSYALMRLPRLFPSGSVEPWLIALESPEADVRQAVVERVLDSDDPRIAGALGRALESEDVDLRRKAAEALARRGDERTADVLAGFLGGPHESACLAALVALARAPSTLAGAVFAPWSGSRRAAERVSERLANDPERSTARLALVRTLGDLGDPAGARALLDLVASTEPDDEALRRPALAALLAIARDPARPDRRLASGATLPRYDEAAATGSLDAAARSVDVGVRLDAARALAAIEAPEGERILGALVLDREADVRFAAAEALAARVESFAAASLEPLAALLRAGRRELVLPAAEGLAARRRPEAFQALLLVFKAGEPSEQARAALALGTLGDRRVIEHLTPFVDPKSDVEDRTLAPDVAEALARMLGRLEGEDQATVRAIVHRLATEGDPSLRARAIAGLARAGDDVSRALVERVASEPLEPTRVRVEATRALARFGRVESEEVLAALLHDADATVRAAAKATLHALFPAEPTRVELHALASPHAELRQPAASFLSTRGDAAVLVARLAALDDAEVRRRLRHGLARRKAAPRAEIERLLEHAQPGPREDAALLAGAAASPELRAALEAALAGAARAFAEHRARAVGPARAREGAVVSSAWASTLWAARRVGADVGAGARAAAATTTAPGEVRRAALRALGGAATDGDRGLVASALADGEASTRRAGAALLPGLGAAAVEVVRAADSVDPGALAPWVRALPAADLARLTADAPTFPPLAGAVLAGGRVDAAIAIARDVTRALPARLVAIATLGLFGGAEAKATLEALYASGETAELKRAAFRALRRLLRGEAKRWADGEDRERRGAGGRFGGGEEEDAGDDDLGDDEESGDEDLDDDGDSDDDDNGDLGEDDDGDSGDDDDDGEFDDDDDDDDDDGEDDDDE